MALDATHDNWIPQEILILIAKKLPLRSRRSLCCVSSRHHETIRRWRDTTYGQIWFTDDQEILVENVLQCPTGIVHLKAPPSTGKTAIALASALGEGGFVPKGELLFIAVAAGLSGIWAKEVEKMFPTKNILKVCSGGVSYKEGVERLKENALKDRKYDVVIATPVWIRYYIGGRPYTATTSHGNHNYSYDGNTRIRWLILDEAHRDGNTKHIVNEAQRAQYPSLQFLMLLSANVVGNNQTSTTPSSQPIRLLTELSSREHTIPTCINTFHAGEWNTPYANKQQEEAIDKLIEETKISLTGKEQTYTKKIARQLVGILIRLTMSCIERSKVSFNEQHRILGFCPMAVSLCARNVKLLPLVSGYKIFTMRCGSNNIVAVDDFHRYTGRAILFMTYKGGSTGFSIDADEVFLLDSLQGTQAYVYQACKRIERITNPRRYVYAHYVESDIYRAIFSYHAAELDAKGVKIVYTTWLTEEVDMITKRFEIMEVDAHDCDAATFLYICYPHFKPNTVSGRYVRDNLPSEILLKYKELIATNSTT